MTRDAKARRECHSSQRLPDHTRPTEAPPRTLTYAEQTKRSDFRLFGVAVGKRMKQVASSNPNNRVSNTSVDVHFLYCAGTAARLSMYWYISRGASRRWIVVKP